MTADECRNCGSHVSAAFVRVFGSADGEIHACPDCTTREALNSGAGADPDRERRVDAPLSAARRQAGETPRSTWDDRRTSSPEVSVDVE